jgi:hypothetical protein
MGAEQRKQIVHSAQGDGIQDKQHYRLADAKADGVFDEDQSAATTGSQA